MKRFSMPGAALALLLAACGGQESTGPCTFRVNVFEMPQVQVGSTVPVDLELSVKSGKCPVPTDAHVTWESSNINVVEVVSSTTTSAQVRAKKQGSAFITAFLTLNPSARDSITFNVFAPIDR